MEINTRTWAMATIIRAIRTIAQVAVATIGTTATLQEVDWALVASTSALAGILSILMALGGLPEVNNGLDVDPDESSTGTEF